MPHLQRESTSLIIGRVKLIVVVAVMHRALTAGVLAMSLGWGGGGREELGGSHAKVKLISSQRVCRKREEISGSTAAKKGKIQLTFLDLCIFSC